MQHKTSKSNEAQRLHLVFGGELTELDGAVQFWEEFGGNVLDAITPAVAGILAARVAAAVAAEREACDKAWQALLNELPDQMAEAWGRDAAWLTTGSKVADLVGDWLADLRYDLPERTTP